MKAENHICLDFLAIASSFQSLPMQAKNSLDEYGYQSIKRGEKVGETKRKEKCLHCFAPKKTAKKKRNYMYDWTIS